MGHSYGILKEPLHYVVHPDDEVPAEFTTNQEAWLFQLPLQGDSFELDNAVVYSKLKEFLIDSPRWAWIEPYDAVENVWAAFKA